MPAKDALENELRRLVCEDTKDALVQATIQHIQLPWWLKWLPVKRVLKQIFPGPVLNALISVLVRT